MLHLYLVLKNCFLSQNEGEFSVSFLELKHPFSDVVPVSMLLSLLGMPFPGLLTWYVLADTSFFFVFSARKRLTQLWFPFQATVQCLASYILGNILTCGLFFFDPFNLPRFLKFAFCVIPQTPQNMYLKSLLGYINGDI